MKPKRQYYCNYDFYNMKSDDQLTILEHFPTHQWTIPCACGPNATLMILNYFKDYSLSEKEIFDEVDCKIPDGYHYFSAFKFYTMWFDDRFLPVEHRIQPYIVVKGRKNS